MSKYKDEMKGKRHPVKPGTIEMEAIMMASIVEENKDKMVETNSDSFKAYEPMSTELQKGMTIVAHDGKDGKKAKQEDNER